MKHNEIKTKDFSHIDISQLENYVIENQNVSNPVLADTSVNIFLSNYDSWKEIVGYMVGGKDGEDLYGTVLCKYSSSLYLSTLLSPSTVKLLQSELHEYEDKVKYKYEIKSVLYSNLVLCIKKLSTSTKDELKDYIKQMIYYSLALTNHTAYKIECFAYRSTEDHVLKSISNETVGTSSPSKFNDPFDCPILGLLELYGDDISKLICEVYKECLKITCFVKNIKVVPEFDENNTPIWKSKHENDSEEFLNELMWAHYAGNHTGICIKYHFENNITKFADSTKSQLAYFRDIFYTSDMDVYRKNEYINLHDAFFAKGKAWEYENELRLLTYDPNVRGDYSNISAPNSISAIYFGFKCPQNKREEIISILKGRKWVNEVSKWDKSLNKLITLTEEHSIDFFQMQIDETHFGKLKAVKIGES